MRLQGLHHITMITGDAQRNVDFWADLLGLRLVKKTVNFDAPEAYHLYFGDEQGSPGSILTWFEFAGATPGRAGAGMIHRLVLGVASEEALTFWERRLAGRGHGSSRAEGSLRFEDPDGLALELRISERGNAPLTAVHPEVPPEHAIESLEGARAYSSRPEESDRLLSEVLGFTELGAGEHVVEGEKRRFGWSYDPAPGARGLQGAGTVHHIAWASRDQDHIAWQEHVARAGAAVTGVRDRDYFRSIYFREPRGVLFEIATLGPGFAVDEHPDRLGEELRLPEMHAHLRERLERSLRPVVNPRAARREQAVR